MTKTKNRPGALNKPGRVRKAVDKQRGAQIQVVGQADSVDRDTGEVVVVRLDAAAFDRAGKIVDRFAPSDAAKAPAKPQAAREMTKIKFSRSTGKVHLEYRLDHGKGEPDEYLLKCGDAPLPSFEAAFAALAGHAVAWLEVVDRKAPLTVSGVSVSYTNGVMGATLTCRVPLSRCQAPLIVNTPHKPAEPYGEGGDESVCMTTECAEAVRTLIDEAWRYVDGERAQGRLFADGAEDGEEES